MTLMSLPLTSQGFDIDPIYSKSSLKKFITQAPHICPTHRFITGDLLVDNVVWCGLIEYHVGCCVAVPEFSSTLGCTSGVTGLWKGKAILNIASRTFSELYLLMRYCVSIRHFLLPRYHV